MFSVADWSEHKTKNTFTIIGGPVGSRTSMMQLYQNPTQSPKRLNKIKIHKTVQGLFTYGTSN